MHGPCKKGLRLPANRSEPLIMRRENDLRDALDPLPSRRRTGVRFPALVLLALTFTVGWICGMSWATVTTPDVVYECSGDQLVGTLFTDDAALAVPGRLILAWNHEGNKKLINRDLFEICAVVPTNET